MPSNELRHFGVKGMRWGHRQASGSGSSKPRKMTRQEVKADKTAFYEKKLSNVLEKSLKDPKTLVTLTLQGESYPTVVTGKEFVDYASRGGLMNARTTDIYATLTKDGYKLNENVNQRYKKPGS
jgi:hypothetical protein